MKRTKSLIFKFLSIKCYIPKLSDVVWSHLGNKQTIAKRLSPCPLPEAPCSKPRKTTCGMCAPCLLTTILMLGLTGITVLILLAYNRDANYKHFNELKSKLENEIIQRVEVYKYGLMGTRSVFVASHQVERDEFRKLVSARFLNNDFPAATGIGYIEYVPAGDLDSFLEQTRADGIPNYNITRFKKQIAEPDYMLVKYIEPVSQNAQVLGLDIGSENIRRDAAIRAMQTGKVTLTHRITLTQASDQGAGFLILLPLYDTAQTPEDPQQRVQSIKGWIYMPILTERIFLDVTQHIDNELDFAVFDGQAMLPGLLLFDQNRFNDQAHTVSAQNSRFHDLTQIQIGGQQWAVSMRTTSHFKTAPTTTIWLTGCGGVIFSILLGMLIRSQASAVTRANQIAEDMTNDLRANVLQLNEAKRAAEEARNSAERANATKSDFLATMSHEIRTPLNGILGMSSVLSKSKLNAEQMANIKTIMNSSKALLTIINDILDISKIEAGKLELEQIDFSPKKIAQEIIELLKFMAQNKGIKLSMKIEDNVPKFVNGDPIRTRQIILNLMNNAIKFTDKGRVSLHIKLKSQGKDQLVLHFAIKDTGQGIDGVKQNQLFKKFSQMDVSTTRKYGGTGLGLAICKSLTEMMNGEINVESKAGKGSTFWFTLQYKTAINAKGSKKIQASQADKTVMPETIQKATILVVDDNAVNCMVASKMLEILGINVTLAQSAFEAFEYAKNIRYDIILMDCQMPVMDGFEATAQLRKHHDYATPASVPIIALTANASASDRTQCLNAGMSDFLAKPVTLEKFSQMINQWLNDPEHLAA